MGYIGICVTSLNSMIKIDLMEKMKSEQTLEKGKGVNHKLFRVKNVPDSETGAKPLGGSFLVTSKNKEEDGMLE